MQKVFLIIVGVLVVFVLVLGVVRILSGGEDSWICSNGEWVKHGQPEAAMPTEECE